jgi:hypothetical protein
MLLRRMMLAVVKRRIRREVREVELSRSHYLYAGAS